MEDKKKTPENGKEELELRNMEEVAGGSTQVEVKNIVKDNKKPVKIGATVVINM